MGVVRMGYTICGRQTAMSLENDDIIGDEEAEESRPFNPISRKRFLKEREAETFDPIGDIKWVYHALGVDGLRPTDAPSAGAWRLLHECQDDLAVLKAFYAGSFAKLLATQVQTEKESSRVDDEREEFGLIDRLLREPDDLAPILNDVEGRARKLAISKAGSPGGV